MKSIDWHNLSEKQKIKLSKYMKTVIVGSIKITENRIHEIYSKYRKEKELLVWCTYIEENIDGLGGEQFTTLKAEELRTILIAAPDLLNINLFQKDLKYLIRELNPKRLVFINGSWQKTIHNRSEFWEAYKSNSDVDFISPFTNDDEALTFAKIAKEDNDEVTSFMSVAEEEASNSYCWVFQNGAVIVRDGEILVKASNVINPEQTYCMHNGCIREELKLASGEELEKCMSTHAEQNVISIAAREGININGSTLFTTTFPCGICAKAIAASGIKEVIYKNPYSYKIGKEIMRNIKLTNIK